MNQPPLFLENEQPQTPSVELSMFRVNVDFKPVFIGFLTYYSFKKVVYFTLNLSKYLLQMCTLFPFSNVSFNLVLHHNCFISNLQARFSHFFPSTVQEKVPSLKTVETYRQVKVRFVPIKTRHLPFGRKDKSMEIWVSLKQLTNYDF